MKKNKVDQQEFTVYYVSVRGNNEQAKVKAKDMAAAIRRFESEHPGAKLKTVRAPG